ncbi:lysoplasmalogenase, partial [Candidatus Bipolaricaulota bacterium]|nr:lysoplasmalogenase [Candidatus Bipolaricaulota bacterium]
RLPPYQYAIVAGLVCSLVGDVVLMLPKRRLFPGLVSFLMAHISYIVAFSWGVRLSGSPLLVTPFFVFLVVVSVILLPHLGRMKVPVIAYELVILTMAWRALERWFQVESVSAFLAFLAALIFIFSDSLHGIREFVRKFRIAQALILSTYFCAQWLIALSV